MRLLPLLSLSLAAGCAFYDGRGRFEIEPAGELVGCTFVRLRVAASEAEGAFLRVDGGAEKWVPTNVTVTVVIPEAGGVAGQVPLSGRQRFRVRARSEAGFPREVERAGVVDCTTRPVIGPDLVSFEPAAGPVDGTVPLQVRVTFSEALDPARVTPAAFQVQRAVSEGAGASVTALALDPDGRTVRMTIEPPLEQVGPVTIRGRVTDLLGDESEFGIGAFEVPVLRPTFLAPAEGAATNGTIAVVVGGSSTAPASTVLYAGGVPVATPGEPPFTVTLDTAGLPEGAHRLSLRASGAFLLPTRGPVFTVDRTPPRVTGCPPSPAAGLPIDLSFGLQTSEPVVGANPRLLVNGAPAGLAVQLDPVTFAFSTGALAPPATVVPEIGGARDLVGNALEPFTCTLEVPVWRRPWGADPFGGQGGAWQAGAAGMGALASTSPTWIVWTTSAGQVRGGVVSETGALDPLFVPANADPAGIASGLVVRAEVAAWTERAAGEVRVHGWRAGGSTGLLGSWARLNPDPGLDAGEVAAAGSSLSSCVAWSERGPAGGRRIAGQLLLGDAEGTIPDLRADPGAVAREPALATVPDGFNVAMARLAWIEEGPGPARLRVAKGSLDGQGALSWAEDAGPWSTSTAAPAEPSLAERGEDGLVVWREGGSVLASVWTPAGGYGPPAVLDTGPGRQARMPRAAGSWWGGLAACFAETGALGDEIWCRTWDGTSWALAAEAVNAGATGPVMGLQVNTPGLIVTWLDSQGRIRSRMLNR